VTIVAGAAAPAIRPAAVRTVLRLVPLFCGERAELLDPLAERLERLLPVAVEPHPPGFDPELAYDPSRGQYNSRTLLAQLLGDANGADRILGVAGVDLFIPVLTFVFGEAQLDGRAAVVSTQRLDNALYGLPPAPALLFARLVKEAVHELGHTFALLHCPDGRCVMASSTYVEQIDLKGERFCDRCLDALRAHPLVARGRPVKDGRRSSKPFVAPVVD
jgi:archaemetzincin